MSLFTASPAGKSSECIKAILTELFYSNGQTPAGVATMKAKK